MDEPYDIVCLLISCRNSTPIMIRIQWAADFSYFMFCFQTFTLKKTWLTLTPVVSPADAMVMPPLKEHNE